MVEHLNSLEHFNQLVAPEDADLVIVDYYADWCGPCKAAAPIFEEMAQTHKTAKFYKVNVDKAVDLAADGKISSLPTFKIFKNGVLVGTVIGFDKIKIEKHIAEHK
ncbi:hypothetical protein MHBO_001366 [Bonamia ostreae]|uniref:Thioredoxin n=1 Tax=Bonamia ostreae TaxID=126728 RepID=A0ABV2AIQ4_9EUKA